MQKERERQLHIFFFKETNQFFKGRVVSRKMFEKKAAMLDDR